MIRFDIVVGSRGNLPEVFGHFPRLRDYDEHLDRLLIVDVAGQVNTLTEQCRQFCSTKSATFNLLVLRKPSDDLGTSNSAIYLDYLRLLGEGILDVPMRTFFWDPAKLSASDNVDLDSMYVATLSQLKDSGVTKYLSVSGAEVESQNAPPENVATLSSHLVDKYAKFKESYGNAAQTRTAPLEIIFDSQWGGYLNFKSFYKESAFLIDRQLPAAALKKSIMLGIIRRIKRVLGLEHRNRGTLITD